MDPRAAKIGFGFIYDRVEIGNDCWEWRGCRAPNGYGMASVRLGGRSTTIGAHRLVYEHLVGPVPEGLELDHLCSNRGCVRPAHLEAVTHWENHLRAGDRRVAMKASGAAS